MSVSRPRDAAGLSFRAAWRADVVSGFLVFVIALPLCLGISMASGFPPFAGVVTAIVGGLLASLLGGAPLTIKGPAAGLIVIVLGAVDELGHGDAQLGYARTLAVVVVSGAVLALLGALKAGRLADVFPSSAVHGMLAAIGVIIFSKQAHVALGVTPEGRTPLALLLELPRSVLAANPDIALIGAVSLAILFGWPALRRTIFGRAPAPLAVLLVSVPMGLLMDLEHEHRVHWGAMLFDVGPAFLVRVPERLLDVVTFPDLAAVPTAAFWKHVVLFTLVGGLESVLSVKAVDALDPWGRKADPNRDLVAQGLSNVVAGALGGLPMISEIVRSSANITYGGRTRLANLAHGAFLLAFVALVPALVHRIPLAALAAMLIATGVRLASPKEFAHALELGREQLAIFVTTLVVTVATDLLAGVAAGVALKLAIHLARGASPRAIFHVRATRADAPAAVHLKVEAPAIFTNYLSLRRHLDTVALSATLVLDLSAAAVVDHTVLEHLSYEAVTRERAGGRLEIIGLEGHAAAAEHPLAARVRSQEAPS